MLPVGRVPCHCSCGNLLSLGEVWGQNLDGLSQDNPSKQLLDTAGVAKTLSPCVESPVWGKDCEEGSWVWLLHISSVLFLLSPQESSQASVPHSTHYLEDTEIQHGPLYSFISHKLTLGVKKAQSVRHILVKTIMSQILVSPSRGMRYLLLSFSVMVAVTGD